MPFVSGRYRTVSAEIKANDTNTMFCGMVPRAKTSGTKKPAILEIIEPKPKPTLLISVGKSSGTQTYNTVYMAAVAILPAKADHFARFAQGSVSTDDTCSPIKTRMNVTPQSDSEELKRSRLPILSLEKY